MKRPPLYTLVEWTFFRVWFSRLYRVRVFDAARIPAAGPVILVANHESVLDAFFLALATPRPVRYMAKAELFDHAILRWAANAAGAFPVERGSGDRAAVGRATDLLAAGEAIGVFPQGTSRALRDRPWLRGAARLAISTGTTIVPVCIVGAERALRSRPFRIGFPRVRIVVCEPIQVERGRHTIAAAKELTSRIRQAIEDARHPYGPLVRSWLDEKTG
jgi:1-acyl-sn-glycerol-3-phosphate acyltransferase